MCFIWCSMWARVVVSKLAICALHENRLAFEKSPRVFEENRLVFDVFSYFFFICKSCLFEIGHEICT